MKGDKAQDKKVNKKKNQGDVPKTLENQNLGHNAKKVGLGQNTNR